MVLTDNVIKQYFLTVDAFNTYFVKGSADAAQSVWVHNTCFPKSNELAKRLGTNKKVFHDTIKPEIKKSFSKELRKINSANPDIGISDAGTLVLKNPKTGKTVDTGVLFDLFKQ